MQFHSSVFCHLGIRSIILFSKNAFTVFTGKKTLPGEFLHLLEVRGLSIQWILKRPEQVEIWRECGKTSKPSSSNCQKVFSLKLSWWKTMPLWSASAGHFWGITLFNLCSWLLYTSEFIYRKKLVKKNNPSNLNKWKALLWRFFVVIHRVSLVIICNSHFYRQSIPPPLHYSLKKKKIFFLNESQTKKSCGTQISSPQKQVYADGFQHSSLIFGEYQQSSWLYNRCLYQLTHPNESLANHFWCTCSITVPSPYMAHIFLQVSATILPF